MDQHNVSELLSLSVLFQMVKLKSYCCEYLSRNLNSKKVHTAVDLAVRHGLYDLQRRGFSFLQRSFSYIYDHDHEELIQYGPQLVIGIVIDNWIISIFLILTSFFSFLYSIFARKRMVSTSWFGAQILIKLGQCWFSITWTVLSRSSVQYQLAKRQFQFYC